VYEGAAASCFNGSVLVILETESVGGCAAAGGWIGTLYPFGIIGAGVGAEGIRVLGYPFVATAGAVVGAMISTALGIWGSMAGAGNGPLF